MPDATEQPDWKDRLRRLVEDPSTPQARRRDERRRIKGFIAETVVPALEEVAAEMQALGRDAELEFGDRMAALTVYFEGEEEFYYEVRAKAYRKRDFAFPVIPLFDAEGQTHRAEASVRAGELHHDVTDYDRDDLIESFMAEYERHLRWER